MKQGNRRTTFIVITRGFLARAILRSGVLQGLKEAGFKIVIFFPSNDKTIPLYIREEFEDERVIVEGAPDMKIRGYSFFAHQASFLVYSRSSWVYSQINLKRLHKHPYWKHFDRLVYGTLLSKLHFLKTLARYLEKKIFPALEYREYFDKYKPDLVFSTSVMAKLDIFIMKEAARRGIPTVSMPKSWDNVTMQLYRFIPDYLIVQNHLMKEAVARVQRMDPDKIFVSGFPQFDWYRKPDILMSREAFCRVYGIDPDKKIIFYGSEGAWSGNDTKIVSLLAGWVNDRGALAKESVLLIRPHFSERDRTKFNIFKGQNVIIDHNFTASSFLPPWDPNIEETKLFANLLHHCDVLIAVASTLTLDGACFNKPIINVAFGALFHPKTKKDITSTWYESDHYQWVVETNGIDIVKSEKELLESVNAYLLVPDRKTVERQRLVERLCYKVDGASSERIVRVIKEAVS